MITKTDKSNTTLKRHKTYEPNEPVPVTTIYQDNKTTILLSENGKASSSKHTKHLE